MDTVNASVKITAYLVTENRGDVWTAVNEQLGTTAYGETEEAALLRADEMLAFLVESYRSNFTLNDLHVYLNARGVQHNITVMDSDTPFAKGIIYLSAQSEEGSPVDGIMGP